MKNNSLNLVEFDAWLKFFLFLHFFTQSDFKFLSVQKSDRRAYKSISSCVVFVLFITDVGLYILNKWGHKQQYTTF